MLSYNPKQASAPRVTEKPWLLLLLCTVWVVMGLWGHHPWKPDELPLAAVIKKMLLTHAWQNPTLAGQPFASGSPLYLWFAALSAKVFSPWLLPLHDAARLSTGVFMGLALWWMGLAGRTLLPKRHGRVLVVVLIGCVGLVLHGHLLSGSVAGLAGFALAFLAWAWLYRQRRGAYVLLVLAVALIALTAGALACLMVCLQSLFLSFLPAWRIKLKVPFLVIALVLGLALAAGCWFLFYAHPQQAWLDYWRADFTPTLFNPFVRLFFYIKNLAWFAWPALPLAMWAAWRHRRSWRSNPVLQLAFSSFMLWLACLFLSQEFKDVYALPLLLPLALLAASEIDSLKRNAASVLNWFGLMSAGLFATFVWLCWFALYWGVPQRLGEKARELSPDYSVQLAWAPSFLAALLTLVWAWAILRKRPLGRQAVTNWACSITLFWSLLMLLALPWGDANKSYNAMMQKMQPFVRAGQCMNTIGLTDNHHAALYYYLDLELRTIQDVQRADCPLVLTQNPPANLAQGWTQVWQGSRARDKRELFYLYRQDDTHKKTPS